MRQRTRRRLGFLVFLILVMATLSVALWQYHQMIVGIYDGASASVYRRMLSPFREPDRDGLGHRPIRAALLHSDATVAALGADAEGLDNLVGLWERFLSGEGVAYRRISRLTGEGALDEFNLLILPAASALRDSEIEAVKRHLRRGNGVLMTWASGSRDEEGRWRQFPLLQQIAGLELAGPVPGDPEALASVLLDSRSPLLAGVSPGFVLSLHRYDQPMYAVIREDRTRVVGAWTPDARLDPHRMSLPPFAGDRTVIASGDYLGGRFIWMGFTLASTVETAEQRDAAHRLLRNSMAWASRQAIAYRAHWPQDVRSAFSLSLRLSHAGDVDDRFLALASQYRVPLTTFLSADLIEEDPGLVSRLQSYGEVGLLHDAGSSPDETSRPSPDRLRRVQRTLAENGTGSFTGFSSDGHSLSTEWLDALLRSGFRYLASTEFDHLMPTVVRTYRPMPVLYRSRELWMLPETPYDSGSRSRPGSREDSANGMLDLFRVIHDLGGYYNLSLSAESIDTGVLQQLDALLATVKRERVWTGTVSDIAEYYRVWGHIKVSTSYPTPNRTAIQLSNTGTESVREIRIYLRMPQVQRRIDLEPTTLGTPSVQPVTEDGILWRFDVSRLPAGKNFMYHLYRD